MAQNAQCLWSRVAQSVSYKQRCASIDLLSQLIIDKLTVIS